MELHTIGHPEKLDAMLKSELLRCRYINQENGMQRVTLIFADEIPIRNCRSRSGRRGWWAPEPSKLLQGICRRRRQWWTVVQPTHAKFERHCNFLLSCSTMNCCKWFNQTSEVWERGKMNCFKWFNQASEVWETFQASVFLEQDELLQVIQPGIWGLRELLCFCVLGARWIVACFLC